jgi:hypothetical protein
VCSSCQALQNFLLDPDASLAPSSSWLFTGKHKPNAATKPTSWRGTGCPFRLPSLANISPSSPHRAKAPQSATAYCLELAAYLIVGSEQVPTESAIWATRPGPIRIVLGHGWWMGHAWVVWKQKLTTNTFLSRGAETERLQKQSGCPCGWHST